MRTQEFEVPVKFITLNEYVLKCKQHWAAATTYKHKAQQEIIVNIRQAKIKKIKQPCFIEFYWYEESKRRDKDNVAFAKKFLLDALQEAGILINDNNNYLKGFSDFFVYGEGQKVVVKIIEGIDDVR